MNAASGSRSDTAGSTSSDLIRRAQSRDQEAWQRLAKLYGTNVYDWARGAGLQPSDAVDVMQEVFRAVATHIGDFRRDDPSHSFRGWLWTITRNKIRDHYRDVSARSEVTGGSDARRQLEQIPDLSSDPAPPGDEASESYLRDQAREMVRAQFEDRTWQAFWRVGARGDKPADVAEDLGMSVGAVYMAKSRVLRSVREMFDELF